MKMYLRIFSLLMVLLLSTACVPVATPGQEIITVEPHPTIQPELTEKFYPLNTRTGIAEIDTILDAVESSDPQEFRDQIHYSTLACMTVNALGGPPPCEEGEATGSLVEVLPILGAEGGHLRKADIKDSFVLDVTGLYAVYRVSENVFSDENYPKGEYGVILVGVDNSSNAILHIKEGGIVRIDYLMSPSPDPLVNALERGAAEIILAPNQ